VRRIVDGYTSNDGKTSILLNYMLGQDYPLERLPQQVIDALEAMHPGASKKNIVLMTRAQRQIVFDDAKRQSLSVLYHLQNFVHDRAADKTNSFRHFHLSDEFGTPDQLPPKPYIRESSARKMRTETGFPIVTTQASLHRATRLFGTSLPPPLIKMGCQTTFR
jgi:hypothetical protein